MVNWRAFTIWKTGAPPLNSYRLRFKIKFHDLKEGQAFGSLPDFSSARQQHFTLENP
jgi:hypothetical protein